MKIVKPKEYAEMEFGGSVGAQTIINGIKAGKIKGKKTPGGHWRVIVDDTLQTNSEKLFDLIVANKKDNKRAA